MEHTAIWLLPAAEEEILLRAWVGDLAYRYQAPLFDPHVTVFAGAMGEAQAWEERLRHVATGVGKLRLTVAGIRHSPRFTKTLYIELEPHPLLEGLHRRARSFSRGPGTYALEPHLSLMYAVLPERERQAAAAALPAPPPSMAFDHLRAVRIGPTANTPEDVQSWWTLASVRLEA